jgi:hypothetical protein
MKRVAALMQDRSRSGKRDPRVAKSIADVSTAGADETSAGRYRNDTAVRTFGTGFKPVSGVESASRPGNNALDIGGRGDVPPPVKSVVSVLASGDDGWRDVFTASPRDDDGG